ELMTLTFKIKMRGEIKFNSLDALFSQIRNDILEIQDRYRK
ncbi:MAG: riboflavin kinase, partial [Eubacterium sp.]